MKGKIYCIVGRSATGKTSVTNCLEKMGYKVIVSTTTRPKRINEIEGKDYYFISEEEFIRKLNNNDFIENTIYNNWMYGIDKHHVDIENNNYIVVVEVNGYKQMVQKLGQDKVIPLLLHISPYERLKRAVDRQPNEGDSACKEICRRFLSDYDLFDEFEKNISSEQIFININSIKTALEIDNYITTGKREEVYYVYR